MIELPFTKMHGLGNCFILMDDRATQASPVQTIVDRAGSNLKDLAIAVCDRNFGIGADGLILVCEPSVGAQHAAPLRMRIFNEDGSEPEMCGNGIRCFTKFVSSVGATPASPSNTAPLILRIETLAGIMETRLLDNGDVEVDMGEPRLKTEDVLASGGEPIVIKEQGREFTFVSMGNPHAITFVDGLDFDWRKSGASVERSLSFPNRTNVEFVKVLGRNEAEVKVWERGCGETMACGTGACAVAVAGALNGVFSRESISIHLPGGTLKIHWAENNHVMMTGPAVTVCEGTFFF